MDSKKENLIWLIASIVCFGFMSVSFLLMPLDSTEDVYDAMDVIPGAMFWLFLILGSVAQYVLAKRRRTWLEQDRKRKFKARKGRNGLLSVFQNVPAIVADVSFIVSFIGFILMVNLTAGLGYGCYVFLGICVFAFCLHCIFNGKIYKYVMGITNEGGNGNGKV